MQQALQLQTHGQDGDQETCSNDKCKVAGYQVLLTKVQACTYWSLPKMVRPPSGQQMLVVWRRKQDGGPDAGTSLPPLQPVEIPATDIMEGSGKSDEVESRQMQTLADL